MEISKAIEILRVLENGADPFTGKVFPDNTVYRHPEIVRALNLALSGLALTLRRAKRKRELPDFAGHHWSADEDGKLAKEFESGKTVKDICTGHKRTSGAILSRLIRSGRIRPGGPT
jgi:hypothetical protein